MAGQTRIGQFLKSKGSSQSEAASVLGISNAAMSMKATGITQFKAVEVKKLAEHYGMTDAEIREVFL